VVVAREDRVRANQDLAVVGDLELDARKRLADGAELVFLLEVHRRRRRHLGEAVALQDQDVDRVEELRDVA
jgi:hypothetical protein